MGLLAAELRKLWTVRTTWAITVVGWGLVALSAGTLVLEDRVTGRFTGTDPQVAAAIEQIAANSVIVLVVAVLLVTTEFRHGTIGRTLQLEPSRTRVLAAKLGGGVVYGLAFFATGLVVVGLLLLAAPGGGPALGEQALRTLWEGPAAFALTALLAVSVGALLRSQVLALTLALLWHFVLESAIALLLPDVGRWLPFQALDAVFVSDEAMAAGQAPLTPLDPPVALAVFLGYVVLIAVPAGLLLRHRDV